MIKIKVNGPPGTGKTTFLMNLVKTAVESNLYSPKEIAFLSFSRAAAEEARSRILKVLPGYNADDFPWFSTIHSACKKILDVKTEQIFAGGNLELFRKETGFKITAASDDEQFINYGEFSKEEICRSVKSYAVHRGISLKEAYWELTYRSVDYSYAEYFVKCLERFKQQRCDRRRIYDFEDLLTETLENERMLPVSLLIVDEAQDLSSLMFQIIEMWAENADRIILAGDPYQAIYEFQGASPKLMLSWKADREITLDRSFRCPSQIHSAARKIVYQMKDRYARDDFFPTESGGFVTRDDYLFGKEWEKSETVFLLCRDNRQVYKRSRALIDKYIPFGYIGKRKNMLNSKGAQMASLLTRLHSGKAVSPEEHLEIIDHIHVKDNLVRGIKKQIKESFGQLPFDEIDKRNIKADSLINFGWTETGFERVKNGSIFSELQGVKTESLVYARTVMKNYGTDSVFKRPNLLIGTIHSSKGKEADLVVIDPTFHNKVKEAFWKSPEIEHRLAYVAVTRARKGVHILRAEDHTYGSHYP